MLREHLAKRGITNSRVLDAFRTVPREAFVPPSLIDLAYEDNPLDIGIGQTISQPYTVAFMTQLLDPQPDDTVLEVGTGSGYQAAILSRLCRKVYTIERFGELGKKAEKVLRQLGYDNVEVTVGDGSLGLPPEALAKGGFDAIIVTAGAPQIPDPLVDQLKIGGRLVIPVGEPIQEMLKITKTEKGLKKESHPGFRFVPLVGEKGFKE
ncbi:protein-L-isoaspartate O-methyltransferase [candidate division WWE3 bacterium RIFCSPLOWO2_01_FULL_53_14]|uniref:Protein-L-isoaspartate O-methyltransferase n=1 Tax=candidate division WWE3 bacterium RIFCSPLOWO2_01_FULL_53_14 TaxID=1802628 RepID=A0A1F4VVK7_UNCKA|nr:MAG: protein-L-isoaspartate O-methyltransferase [candidate division WWE3 bacterium RIFCSPLOWO2_01_FULL_53_14]